MHQYRQVIVRMRLGESDRALAKAGLIGRRKATAVRRLAEEQGWLDPSQALPDDATLARVKVPVGDGAPRGRHDSATPAEQTGRHARDGRTRPHMARIRRMIPPLRHLAALSLLALAAGCTPYATSSRDALVGYQASGQRHLLFLTRFFLDKNRFYQAVAC